MVDDSTLTNLKVSGDFRLADWLVSPSQNRIARKRQEQKLQNLSMQVLVFLASRPGRVVAYQEILDALWKSPVAGEEAVHRQVAILRRAFNDDARAPKFIETIPKRGYRLLATPVPVVPFGHRTRKKAIVTLIVLTISIAAALMVDWRETEKRQSVVDEAMVFVELDDYESAHAVARDLLAAYPESSEARELLAEISTKFSLESKPPDAEVLYREYGSDDDWQRMGVTPFEGTLPRGTWMLKVAAPGYEPAVLAVPNPGIVFNNVKMEPYVIELSPQFSVPEGMVTVPAGTYRVPLLNFLRIEDLGRFHIGRFEVRNGEYQSFLESNAYHDDTVWRDLAAAEGDLSLRSSFVDSTGAPGPATWEHGRYPEGEGDFPVRGVSWYEAMAYARYSDVTLPTARHWARATFGLAENRRPIARSLLAHAVIDGPGPVAANAGKAVSTFGANHLLGNASEWTVSVDGERKLVTGISYRGPKWRYAFPVPYRPTERHPDFGFRIASYDEPFEDPPLSMDGLTPRMPEVGEAEYAEYARRLQYATNRTILRNAIVESEVVDSDWVRRKLIFETDDAAEPLPVLVFMPKEFAGPLQPVIFLPPGNVFSEGYDSEDIDIAGYNLDFLARDGRALVWPVFWGMYERHIPDQVRSQEKLISRGKFAIRKRRQEIGMIIDYLEQSPDFNGRRIGLLAASYGGTIVAPSILASEERIGAAVLWSSGLLLIDPSEYPNVVNPNTYWPHVTTPLLSLQGRYDISAFMVNGEQLLIDRIATPDVAKRVITYEASHWPLPQHRVRRDTLDWFDQYLGEVE
jgi:DNA-binding winged helix-turn-helix (wHTH) protein/dienelactone hydrolase